MSLSQALISAISGLKANQSALALVSANVANAGTAGYVRKSVNQVAVAGSGTGIGVRVSARTPASIGTGPASARAGRPRAGYFPRINVVGRLRRTAGGSSLEKRLRLEISPDSRKVQALSENP